MLFMTHLSLTLELSNLGETTHIWFPTPQAEDEKIKTWFNVVPTEIQTDKKFGNKIAYFYFCKDSPWRMPRKLLKIVAVFPIAETKTLYCEPKQFLQSNHFVESDNEIITQVADKLTDKLKTDEEKVRRCFDFVVDYLTYANPIRGLYSSLQALTDRGVDCGGFSTLLTALLRAVKIPSHCVSGWAIRSKFGYHAWVEYYDRQKKIWIPADPSVANLGNRTKLDAGFGFINDERIVVSIGEDIDLTGEKIRWTIPLLQSPVVISLNHNSIPKPADYHLKWKTI